MDVDMMTYLNSDWASRDIHTSSEARAQCIQDGTACATLSNLLALAQWTSAHRAELHARLDKQVELAGWALDPYESDAFFVAHGRQIYLAELSGIRVQNFGKGVKRDAPSPETHLPGGEQRGIR
jgi:hypothetical protein